MTPIVRHLGSRWCALIATVLIAATLPAQDPRSRVTGTVTDSVRNRPVAGARVQFASTELSSVGRVFVANSDVSGQFTIDSLPPGRYLAGFFHPLLDSLGIDDLVREVRVEPGFNTIALATPSTPTLMRVACRTSSEEAKTHGMIIGRVRSAGIGSPVPHATVQVWWSELIDPPTLGLMRTRTMKASTRIDGWFAICGVPADVTLLTHAASSRDTSGMIPLRITSGDLLYSAFALGTGTRVALQSTDDSTRADTVWRGNGGLRGTVRDDRGQLITGAEITVAGTATSTRTATAGRFTLDSLPTGTQLVELRAIGFEPVQVAVELLDGASNEVQFSMPRRAVNLAPVEVRALAEHRVLEKVRYRMTRGTTAGYYMQPEEIRRRPQDQSMARLIEGFPGVLVTCAFPHSCEVGMYRPSGHVSQSGREVCTPALYIDGRRDRSDDFNQLDARHIIAVEVYPREIGRPVEFMDLHRNCGAVAFWTRRQ